MKIITKIHIRNNVSFLNSFFLLNKCIFNILKFVCQIHFEIVYQRKNTIQNVILKSECTN